VTRRPWGALALVVKGIQETAAAKVLDGAEGKAANVTGQNREPCFYAMPYTRLLAPARARRGLLPAAIGIGFADFSAAARSTNDQPDNQHHTDDHFHKLHFDLLEPAASNQQQ